MHCPTTEQHKEQNAGVITTEEDKSGEEKGMYQKDQIITTSQFELSDELLSSLNLKYINLERKIALHPMGMVDCNSLATIRAPSIPRELGSKNI